MKCLLWRWGVTTRLYLYHTTWWCRYLVCSDGRARRVYNELESRLVMVEISPCYHCLPSALVRPGQTWDLMKVVLGKYPRWWWMMRTAGAGGRLIILILSFDWVTVLTFGSSPVQCPATVLVIFSWILKSFPQFHSEHSWDHKENIHCLRPWFRLVLYIIVPSFIQITAKHSPRSQHCKDLPALKINLSASQLFQVQIPVISVVTASDGSDAERRPRKLFRIDS